MSVGFASRAACAAMALCICFLAPFASFAQEDAVEETLAQEEAVISYPAGNYWIGTDMPAGEYVIVSDDASWDPYSIGSFSLYRYTSNIKNIGRFRFQHHTLVTLYNKQYLELESGTAYPVGLFSLNLGVSGVYKAGRDIEAGTYLLKPLPTDSAWYALYNDNRYYYDYVDDYHAFWGPITVTVSDGQYLELFDVEYVEKTD